MSARFALLRRLGRDRRGAVFVIGAFAILLTGAASMFTADLARVQLARARVQAAADAAMLAAARDLGRPEATLDEIARTVFDVNMTQATRDLTVTDFDLKFFRAQPPGTAEADEPPPCDPAMEVEGKEVETAGSICLRVEAELPLLSNIASRALGWTQTADATAGETPMVFAPAKLVIDAGAKKVTMGAEIMMVLDNTGSMCVEKTDQSKCPIADLRTAARTLADAVFAGRESVPNVYIGLVNYAATVNIGPQHSDWLDAEAKKTLSADFAASPRGWKGCVMVRSAGLAETDATPSVAKFEPQLWPSSRLSWNPLTWDAYYDLKSNRSLNIWPPGDPKDPTRPDPNKPAVNEAQTAFNNGYGPNLGCPAPITPLTESRQAIMNAIDGLGDRKGEGIDAWHRGGTFGNVGLAWGWRALSPEWTGIWRRKDGTANPLLPLPYPTPFHNKIIVMMTDGQNAWHQNDFTAYGRPGEIPIPGGVNASMLRLCSNIKEKGIILFTITFGDKGDDAAPTYKSCASPETLQKMPGQKYFHAPTGPELVSVFGSIAGQISELRLVK